MRSHSSTSEDVAGGFVHILVDDVTHAFQRVENDDSLTHRREALRTVLAAAEGIVWVYREHVRLIAKDLGKLEPLAEFALQEKSYAVGERGDVVEQVRYVPLTTMVRLATKIAAEACPGLEIDFSHVGWANLKTAIAVRNRLTHPKSLTDLTITREEVLVARSGFFWLLATVIEGMAAMNKELSVLHTNARELLERLRSGDQDAIDEYQLALHAPDLTE